MRIQSLHSDVVRNVVIYEPLHFVSQLGCGTHRRILSALRGSAGAGGRKRDPRPPTAGEEDEAAEEEHDAGEGETHSLKLCLIFIMQFFTLWQQMAAKCMLQMKHIMN